MLHEFLSAERENILSMCATKALHIANSKDSSGEMESGLPIFYDELICALRENAENPQGGLKDNLSGETSATRRGKESFRLGYTLSQVVHGYGALCQAITQYAAENASEPIQSREFNQLNLFLDRAIAEAVTEFDRGQRAAARQQEMQRLGFLAHELRNSLSNAAMAHRMIKKGVVGSGGSTARLLENAHNRMRDIIDRSLSKVRLGSEPILERSRCRLIQLVSEVEITASSDAAAKGIQLHVEVAQSLEILADRHLLVSAIANLVQNAIKFTAPAHSIWIRGKAVDGRVLIEVEDQCGGLPPGKVEELFEAFSQKGTDRTGVGLGLTISREAVTLNGGTLSTRDIPGKGCVFVIDMPQYTGTPGSPAPLRQH